MFALIPETKPPAPVKEEASGWCNYPGSNGVLEDPVRYDLECSSR
jgi:hypothetical protein